MYQLKRNFSIGEIVYIPEYGENLPLPQGTATPFTVASILEDNGTDKTTILAVTYQHGSETLKLSVSADKVYKITPSTICTHCGHIVCIECDKGLSKEYPYYCPNCNENMYGIEIKLL